MRRGSRDHSRRPPLSPTQMVRRSSRSSAARTAAPRRPSHLPNPQGITSNASERATRSTTASNPSPSSNSAQVPIARTSSPHAERTWRPLMIASHRPSGAVACKVCGSSPAGAKVHSSSRGWSRSHSKTRSARPCASSSAPAQPSARPVMFEKLPSAARKVGAISSVRWKCTWASTTNIVGTVTHGGLLRQILRGIDIAVRIANRGSGGHIAPPDAAPLAAASHSQRADHPETIQLVCGIAGFMPKLPTSTDVLRSYVGNMTSRLVHRGPDDAGIHVTEEIALGMRRLAIIDVAHGRQPMYSDDGSLVLVFNGEIYNYRRLREQLVAERCAFRTDSDTEVVLRLLERGGSRAIQRLEGMFAFALWNVRDRQLLL